MHAVRVKLTMERKHEKKSLNRQDVAAIQGKELKKRYSDEAKTFVRGRLQSSLCTHLSGNVQAGDCSQKSRRPVVQRQGLPRERRCDLVPLGVLHVVLLLLLCMILCTC